MRRTAVVLAGVLAAVLAVLPVAQAATVADVVGQVSQTSYRDYLDHRLYTHTGDNRGSGAQHNLAQANIYSHFSGLGLETSLDPFLYSGQVYYNVVGRLPGTTRPSDIYIVGAHFDSVNNPGADDNASGVAAVMEAARVLAQHEFEATLLFIAFDREEQGLIGSAAYADEHVGDQIRGMISLDMIAYNPSSNHNMAYVYGRDTSLAVKQDLADAVAFYGGIAPVIGGDLPYSDQASFEAAGFKAALLIEYNTWSNPYYHTASDTVDTPGYIDYPFATNMTRGTVGYLAGSAVIIPEPATMLLLALGAMALAARRRR